MRFERAGVMRRSRASLVTGLVLLVAPLFFWIFSFAEVALMVSSMAFCGALAALLLWRTFQNARQVPAAIRADSTGLWIDDAQVLDPAHIASGRVVRRGSSPVVEVRARGLRQSQRIVVPTEDDASALLAALGHDRRAGLRKFTLPSWRWSSPTAMYLTYTPALALAMVVWAVVGGLPDMTPWRAIIGTLVAACIGAWPALMSWLTRVVVTIAHDGVALDTRLGSRFIPFSEIASVAQKATRRDVSPAADIALVNGKRVRVYTFPERANTDVHDPVLAALQAGLSAARQSQSSHLLLTRGARTTREWLEALRGTELGARGYRESAVSLDELVAIVADTNVSDETRAAAGVALASSTDPEARARLRVATEDIASPRVRVALDASLASDDEAVIEALDALSSSTREATVDRGRRLT